MRGRVGAGVLASREIRKHVTNTPDTSAAPPRPCRSRAPGRPARSVRSQANRRAREVERQCRVLLDDQHSDATLAIEPAQVLEQLLDDERRQTEGRLVEQHQARPQHQRAADRQHLLLATAQRPGHLRAPLLEPREFAIEPARYRWRSRRGLAASSRRAANSPRRSCGQRCRAPLEHGRSRDARCPRWRGQRSVCRRSRSRRSSGPSAKRAQRRRLAGAVGAEQRDNTASASSKSSRARPGSGHRTHTPRDLTTHLRYA